MARVSKGALAREWKFMDGARHRGVRYVPHRIGGKYMPHQGAREKARRLRRMASAPTAIAAE